METEFKKNTGRRQQGRIFNLIRPAKNGHNMGLLEKSTKLHTSAEMLHSMMMVSIFGDIQQ